MDRYYIPDSGYKLFGHDLTTVVVHFLFGFVMSLAFVFFVIYNRNFLHKIFTHRQSLRLFGYLACKSDATQSNSDNVRSSQLSSECDSDDSEGDENSDCRVEPTRESEQEDEDEEVPSDYDVISSSAVSRKSSLEGVESKSGNEKCSKRGEKLKINSKIFKSESDMLNDHKKLLNKLKMKAVVSHKPKEPEQTLNNNTKNNSRNLSTKLTLVRIEGGRCGRYRVNPIYMWHAKLSVTTYTLASEEEEGNKKRELGASGELSSPVDSVAKVEEMGVVKCFTTKTYQDERENEMNEDFTIIDHTPANKPSTNQNSQSTQHLSVQCQVFQWERQANGLGDTLLGSGVAKVQIPTKKLNDESEDGKKAEDCAVEFIMDIYAQPEVSESSLLISLNYLPLAERLSIIIMKAKDLRLPHKDDNLQIPHCVYVKVELLRRGGGRSGQQRVKKKTSTQWHSANPVFNDMLGFDISQSELRRIRLKVSVVQRVPTGGGDFENSNQNGLMGGSCGRGGTGGGGGSLGKWTNDTAPLLGQEDFGLDHRFDANPEFSPNTNQQNPNNPNNDPDSELIQVDHVNDSDPFGPNVNKHHRNFHNYYVFGVLHLGSGGKGCSLSESDHFHQMLKSPRVPVAKWHLLKNTSF